jgi:hypothetical protein
MSGDWFERVQQKLRNANMVFGRTANSTEARITERDQARREGRPDPDALPVTQHFAEATKKLAARAAIPAATAPRPKVRVEDIPGPLRETVLALRAARGAVSAGLRKIASETGTDSASLAEHVDYARRLMLDQITTGLREFSATTDEERARIADDITAALDRAALFMDALKKRTDRRFEAVVAALETDPAIMAAQQNYERLRKQSADAEPQVKSRTVARKGE